MKPNNYVLSKTFTGIKMNESASRLELRDGGAEVINEGGLIILLTCVLP